MKKIIFYLLMLLFDLSILYFISRAVVDVSILSYKMGDLVENIYLYIFLFFIVIYFIRVLSTYLSDKLDKSLTE